MLLGIWVLQTLAAVASAQFLQPPSDDTFTVVKGPSGIRVRYQQVTTGPNSICELNDNVESYSGFVDISEHEHLFFWLFGARDVDPSNAHLTAWTSGGPGDASMSELFTEHGPCKVDQNFEITSNQYSWNGKTNMVYVDSPVTVGFSYTDPVRTHINQDDCDLEPLSNNQCPDAINTPNNACEHYGSGSTCATLPDQKSEYTAHTTEEAAAAFYLALQGIYAAFPNFTRHGFTMGSESYGGHYVPVISRHIAEGNANLSPGAVKIEQTSLLVGNGWFDPAVGFQGYYQFIGRPGNTYDVKINDSDIDRMHNALYGSKQCLDQVAVCNSAQGNDDDCRSADDFCNLNVQQVYDNQTKRDEYDVRELYPSPFPDLNYVDYLNTGHVQRALGVFTNYTDESALVGELFQDTGDDAKSFGIVQALTNLLDSGVGVTLYFGDSDYSCNWFGGMTIAELVANGSQTSGMKDAYASAGFQNITTDDHVVHGQVKQAGRLAFVRVYEAGHQVPFFQPLTALAIYERTVNGLDIATGQVNATMSGGTIYKSSGLTTSPYREGRGTVQDTLVDPGTTYNGSTNKPNV